MAYSSDSASDRLSAVRIAIQKVLGGQEYRVGGRMMRYADLKTLFEMERELEWAASDESGASSLQLFQVDRPGAGV